MKLHLFDGIPHNAKWTIMLEPLSSALATGVNFFLPLLMKNTGLTEFQIGLISTINLCLGCAFQFLAPAFVNHFGRRRTLLAGSLICWSVPLLIWSFAQSFGLFVIATLFQATARVTTIAQYCYLTEDVPDRYKPNIFGFISVGSAVGGFCTCVLAPLVEGKGVVTAAHILNFAAFLSMTAMFFIRFFKTTETQVGKEILAQRPPFRLSGFSMSGVKRILKDAQSRKLMLYFILWYFSVAMGVMQTIFLSDVLLLPNALITLMPAVTAVSGIVLYLTGLRPSGRRNRLLLAAPAGYILAYGILCVAPKEQLWPVVIFYILLQCATYWQSVSISPLLNNCMGERDKAETYSFVQLLVVLCSTPAGVITGLLYEMDPYFPFFAMMLLALLCGLLAFSYRVQKSKASQ